MTTITTTQARNRFVVLPPDLQDAVFSEQNAEIIASTADKYHVSESRAEDIAELVGLVLLGFLHPEDLAEEIVLKTALPQQLANDIANSLGNKIFSPLKSDLDKTYAPIPHENEGAVAPRIMQDINPRGDNASLSSATASSGPKIISQTAAGGMSVGAVPLQTNQSKPAAPPKAPSSSLTGPGWSRTTPSEPVVKLNQISAPPPEAPLGGPGGSRSSAGTGAGASAERPATNFPAAHGPIGEFERRAIQPGLQRGLPTPPAGAPPPPARPAPVMLHEVSSFAPAPKPPDFHLQLPEQKIDMSKAQSVVPLKPAVSEFGSVKPAPLAQPGSVSTPRPRVVHYSEYKSPSPETPIAPVAQGPRNVTEITSAPGSIPQSSADSTPFAHPLPLGPSLQKPPAPAMQKPTVPLQANATPKPPVPPPPTPPRPPMPPQQPSQSPQNKVARVDYSA